MMPKAYSYVRFSRPEQMRGDSLRRQVSEAQRWAEERGLELDGSFHDLGVSAYRGKNRTVGALADFLSLVRAGKIERGSYLIVENLDRLSREKVREALPRFLDLINAGITIVTLTDRHEYSADKLGDDPMPLLMSLVIMIRAYEESKLKAERLSKAWKNKRKKATQQIVTARVPAWLEVVTVDGKREIRPILERVRIIKWIIQQTIDGKGRRQIARMLNEKGEAAFLSKNGWHASYVKKLIENRALIGEFQPYTRDADGKRIPYGDPIPDYFPAVVDKKIFEKANATKESRKTSAGRHYGHYTNLLQGFVFCACGARMKRENKGISPKGGTYLVCANATRKVFCEHKPRWRLPEAERIVLAGTSRIDPAAILEEPDETPQLLASDLAMNIEKLQRQASQLLDLVAEGREEAKDRYRWCSDEIKRLKGQQAQLRKEEERYQAEPSLTTRQAVIRDLLPRMDDAEGQALFDLRTRTAQELRSTLSRVTISKHRISITYRTRLRPPGGVPNSGARSFVIHDVSPEYLEEMELLETNPVLLAEEADAAERASKFFAGVKQREKLKTAPAGAASSKKR
jgi:DNA invertase Pin-like site-specific DNA recombinase